MKLAWMLLLFTLALRPPAVLAAESGSPLGWLNWDQGLSEASITKRPILVDVYTDWCGWCKRMDRDVYSRDDVRAYLEYCADQRLATLGYARQYGAKNPFGFLALQDVQEVTNFFERRVSAYQVGVEGEVTFDAAF